MPTLKWLPPALDDLERLIDFLHERSPAAANRAAATILDGAELLLTNPRLGRAVPDSDRPPRANHSHLQVARMCCTTCLRAGRRS